MKIRKARFHISKNADDVLRKLRSYLDSNEPDLVYFLVRNWNLQAKAITYKELREAILAGYIDPEIMEEWYQDYTRFVVEHLRPAWTDAMKAANKDLEKKYPSWYFDPYKEGVARWCEDRAATFVTEVTATQVLGIRAVVERAAVLQDMSVDQLARAIRPMVGLNRPQTLANLNYYNRLIRGGMTQSKALDLSVRYSARQHRYRGYNIARTELAFSYNQGAQEGVKQAQAAGYMGKTVKIWCTADDERVCRICGGLEGTTIPIDDEFDFPTKLAEPGIRKTPPAHPSCRCAVMYKEVEPINE